MSDTKPGADELAVRGRLRKLLGEDDDPPTAEPAPDPDGWWDELYADDEPQPDPSQTPPAVAVPPTKPKKTKNSKAGKKTKPKRTTAPHAGMDSHPRQSLTDAFDRIPPRTRWLLYHATAAAAGWRLGLVDWGTNTAAWYAAGHWTTPSAFVLYGLGVCAICLYRRARAWAWPAAWAAAIPVSSTVVGILLYGTTT